ncbi:hypothetical protein GPECTOR_120g429 [Gonium pectorale]|uniref:EF-hand domain-containing protein n=1 Tax=Gonium pectorale TaxID=33097 RepID=A0A150FYS7_GONPE|nr:hypothetical protein GPECTOR_120g429 [Gonium pectorale]|eukprot:KXZ42762.1 hypothetical protein GPECTOR_120g429 [Gonium pectorale]
MSADWEAELAGELGDDSGDLGAAAPQRAPAPATRAFGKGPSRVVSKAPSIAPTDGNSGSLFSGGLSGGLSGDIPQPSREASARNAAAPKPAAPAAPLPSASANASNDLEPSAESSGLFGPSRSGSRAPSVLGEAPPAPAGARPRPGSSHRASPHGSDLGLGPPATAAPAPVPAAVGPGSAAAPSPRSSARSSPPASRGRAASVPPDESGDSYSDLLGPPSAEPSGASLRGRAAAAAAAAQAPSPSGSVRLPPSAVQPSASPSAIFKRPAPGGPTPSVSRPASVASGGGAGYDPYDPYGSAGGYSAASISGRSGGGGGLPPPEVTDSPHASRHGPLGGGVPSGRRNATAALSGLGVGSGGDAGERARRLEIKCEIPTPFDLFRLYDGDENGCLTHDEFVALLRDLDSHPDHYDPRCDPEHRLEGLMRRRKKLEALLASRQDGLLGSEIRFEEAEAALAAGSSGVQQAEAALAEARRAEAAAEEQLRKLALTPADREERDKWRAAMDEEYRKTDAINRQFMRMGQAPAVPSLSDPSAPIPPHEYMELMARKGGHPPHFLPHQDPERRLQELRASRKQLEDGLSAQRNSLIAAQRKKADSSGRVAELAGELRDRQAELERVVAAMAAEEAAKRALGLTAEQRAERDRWRKWVEEEFRRADLGGNDILSIDEFYLYYYSKLCFRFPVQRNGVNPGAMLFNVFVKYCSLGRGAMGGRNEDMLSHQFTKLCRDAELINGTSVTKAALGIIYHRARAADESLETYKPKAGVAATARMYYPQFLFALNRVAEKRRSGFQEVVARVLARVETLPEPSFSDFVLLSAHDLEPGAEVPEYLTRPRPLPDNSKQLRAAADSALMKKMKDESQDVLHLSTGPDRAKSAARQPKPWETGRNPDASGGGAAPPASASNDVAADTAPPPPAPARRGTYGELAKPTISPDTLREKKWEQPEPRALRASRAVAAEKGMSSADDPETMFLVRGLDPDALMVGLKRVFEGYAAAGGGADRGALDKPRWSAVLRTAGLVAESGPLPQRRVDAIYGQVLPPSSRALNFLQFIEALRHVSVAHRLALNEVMERLVAVGPPAQTDPLLAALKRVYSAHATAGRMVERAALDRPRWAACLRQAGLLHEGGPLSGSRADDVFSRCVPHGSSSLGFLQFLEALRQVAALHRTGLDEVMQRLVAAGGPQ